MNGPTILVVTPNRPVKSPSGDPWGLDNDTYPVLDAVVVRETDETYEHDNGYDTEQLTVWQCSFTARKFIKIPPIDYGCAAFWRHINGASGGHRRWNPVEPTMRYTIGDQPITAEQLTAAAVTGNLTPRHHMLTIDGTEDGTGIALGCHCGYTGDFHAPIDTKALTEAIAEHGG